MSGADRGRAALCRVGKEELQQELHHCRQSGQFAQAELDQAASALQLDLELAAELVLGMRDRLNRCRRCAHGRRPGLSDGYCIHRQDLPLAYGMLRELPADRGAWCESFEEAHR